MTPICYAWNIIVCAVRKVVSAVRGALGGRRKATPQIKHVFVLMLENRAFDHMLGLAGLKGTDAVNGKATVVNGLTSGLQYSNLNPTDNNQYAATSGADFFLAGIDQDPAHEFDNARMQLCGYRRAADGTLTAPPYPDPNTGSYPPINNAGFIASYVTSGANVPQRVMRCYASEQVPVLTALAREFAVCDNWFSSLPGPTWPNRFFIHAASSGGLDDSPSGWTTATSTLFDGYRFDNGTVYDLLEDRCLDWRVYEGDEFPQVFAISGMNTEAIQHRFHDFDEFSDELGEPDFSQSYVFIEPDYGNVIPHLTAGDFTCGNSQHPLDDVTRGERLIKTVYEILRNSPYWNDSLLVITYDEQGGFFDHVAPPGTVAPGDPISDPDNNHHNFDFTQLGVRVPAVVVSPLIPRGTIDHTLYDHTSLLATVEKLFGLGTLTNRDRSANDFRHLLALGAPRPDTPTVLPEPANSGFRCEDDAEGGALGGLAPSREVQEREAARPIEPMLRGFLHVAFLRDYHMASWIRKPGLTDQFLQIKTRGEALAYLDEARGRAALRLQRRSARRRAYLAKRRRKRTNSAQE